MLIRSKQAKFRGRLAPKVFSCDEGIQECAVRRERKSGHIAHLLVLYSVRWCPFGGGGALGKVVEDEVCFWCGCNWLGCFITSLQRGGSEMEVCLRAWLVVTVTSDHGVKMVIVMVMMMV